MKIQKAGKEDVERVAALALLLWPDHTELELIEEFTPLLQSDAAAVFLAVDGEAIGFAQCQLRSDYVEGTSSSPVGYLEGIYVKEAFRRQGIARALSKAGEDWAKRQGCLEFASDTGVDNISSIQFHKKSGFKEANRIVCFVKRLDGTI